MEKKLALLLLDSGKYGQSGPAELFWPKHQTKAGTGQRTGGMHNLFDLKGANGGDIPIMRYFEMDVAFLGLRVPKVGFLVV